MASWIYDRVSLTLIIVLSNFKSWAVEDDRATTVSARVHPRANNIGTMPVQALPGKLECPLGRPDNMDSLPTSTSLDELHAQENKGT